MKKSIKRTVLILILALTCVVSWGNFSTMAEDSYKDMGNKVISDVNKIWTLRFSAPVNVNSLRGNVSIEDITDKSTINASVSAGDEDDLTEIKPPSGGYKLSHEYRLHIEKDVKSKEGKNLSKPIVFSFKVVSDDSYKASADVVVSPVLPMLKQITVNTDLPSAAKYQIEGNNNLFDIGKAAVSISSGNTVQICMYDAKGNLLGTSRLDVSSTKSDISMDITLAN
ncbi:Ig-like domain-containing protein [Clostridium sp. LBM24168]